MTERKTYIDSRGLKRKIYTDPYGKKYLFTPGEARVAFTVTEATLEFRKRGHKRYVQHALK